MTNETIKIKIGPVFIDEIYLLDYYDREEDDMKIYPLLYAAWSEAIKTKPNRKVLTVQVPVELCNELLSWADYNATLGNEDAADYLPLRRYCRRLIRRVKEQGYIYSHGQLSQIEIPKVEVSE